MNSVEKYVFSRTLNSVDWENTKLVKDDAVSQVKELKKRQGSDIFVFGSADFSSTLMKHELVDEYHFGVNHRCRRTGHPVVQRRTQHDGHGADSLEYSKVWGRPPLLQAALIWDG